MELKTGDIVFDYLDNASIVAYIAETPKLGREDATALPGGTLIMFLCLCAIGMMWLTRIVCLQVPYKLSIFSDYCGS